MEGKENPVIQIKRPKFKVQSSKLAVSIRTSLFFFSFFFFFLVFPKINNKGIQTCNPVQSTKMISHYPKRLNYNQKLHFSYLPTPNYPVANFIAPLISSSKGKNFNTKMNVKPEKVTFFGTYGHLGL